MSKKLLNERQIRRFMELANLPSITEMGVYGDRDEDEGGDPVGGMPPGPDDPDPEGMDIPPEEDVPAPGMDDEAEGEVVLSSEEAQLVADALPAMEKIAAAVGGEEGMEDEEGLEGLEDEEGLEELPPEGPEGAAGSDMGAEEELMEMLANEVNLLDDKEVIDTVMKRVAERLVKESRRQKKDKKIEALAEKIASRIANRR
jgi:hypothetical protein